MTEDVLRPRIAAVAEVIAEARARRIRAAHPSPSPEQGEEEEQEAAGGYSTSDRPPR